MKNKIKNILLPQITQKISVLVVESDNAIFCKFGDYLQKIFASVYYASDSQNAITLALNNNIQLVLLDIFTANAKVFELTNELRGLQQGIQIIAITSEVQNDILLKIIRSGMIDCIQKPLKLIDMKNSILNGLQFIFEFSGKEMLKTTYQNQQELSPKSAISYLMENFNIEVELINHYKGVPIVKEATIIDLVGENVSLRVQEVQQHIIEHTHHAIISSKFLVQDVYAHLKEIDSEQNLVVFNNLSFINSYIHHRKNMRVIPDTSFYMIIELNKIKYNCTIIDVSMNYALITMPNFPKWIELNCKMKFYISFRVPSRKLSNTYKAHSVVTSATVRDIFWIGNVKKVLLHFELDHIDSALFEEYLYKRSLELIKEFKSLLLKNEINNEDKI